MNTKASLRRRRSRVRRRRIRGNSDPHHLTEASPVTIRRADGSVEIQPALSEAQWRRVVKERTKLGPQQQDRIRRRDRGACRYCQGPGEEFDHVVPVVLGGTARDHNIVLACSPCNSKKGSRLEMRPLPLALHRQRVRRTA